MLGLEDMEDIVTGLGDTSLWSPGNRVGGTWGTRHHGHQMMLGLGGTKGRHRGCQVTLGLVGCGGHIVVVTGTGHCRCVNAGDGVVVVVVSIGGGSRVVDAGGDHVASSGGGGSLAASLTLVVGRPGGGGGDLRCPCR